MKTTATNNKILTLMEKKLAENQFYGLRKTLDYFQQVPKMTSNVNKNMLFNYLNEAWSECKVNAEKRKLFYTIFFKHLDIANRDHNILAENFGKNKADKGGDALRKVGIYQLEWLLSQDSSMRKQFYAFLPLIPEYSNYENLFFYQLRTDRKTGKVLETLAIIPDKIKDQVLNEVTDFLASKINDATTTDVEHTLIAKFLPKPKFSKRTRKFIVTEKGLKSVQRKYGKEFKVGDMVTRKSDLQSDTIKKEQFEAELITMLSTKLGWDVIEYPNNTRYAGLESYKAKWNRLSEAYLFSSKEILNWDKEQFVKWLNQIPAGSRFRVQCRLFRKDEKGELISTGKWIGKYGDLSSFYSEWLDAKEVANDKVRELEAKETLTEEETIELKKAKKDAKVNTGAESMLDIIAKIFKSRGNAKELDVIADNILRKIDIKVPSLLFVDRSGSMTSESCVHNGVHFSARDMSKLALTIFLLKNPRPELQSIFGLFSDACDIITDNNVKVVDRPNRYTIGNAKSVDGVIIDRTKPFSWNFQRISTIVDSLERAAGTDISTVARALKSWVDSDPNLSDMRKELINQFRVWVFISDGDMNNSYNATASVQDFQMKMKQWMNWDGLVVIWDVKSVNASEENNKFENLENVIYFGSANQQVLNQVFTNIHDLDIIDIYIPLLTMYRSNRYELVRNVTI